MSDYGMVMPPEQRARWDAWVASRPPSVQALIAEFPPNVCIELDDGSIVYLIGWTENDTLIFSRVDPIADYQATLDPANQVYLCADHLRGQTPEVVPQ